jgi:hypothetical protein
MLTKQTIIPLPNKPDKSPPFVPLESVNTQNLNPFTPSKSVNTQNLNPTCFTKAGVFGLTNQAIAESESIVCIEEGLPAPF